MTGPCEPFVSACHITYVPQVPLMPSPMLSGGQGGKHGTFVEAPPAREAEDDFCVCAYDETL